MPKLRAPKQFSGPKRENLGQPKLRVLQYVFAYVGLCD